MLTKIALFKTGTRLFMSDTFLYLKTSDDVLTNLYQLLLEEGAQHRILKIGVDVSSVSTDDHLLSIGSGRRTIMTIWN